MIHMMVDLDSHWGGKLRFPWYDTGIPAVRPKPSINGQVQGMMNVYLFSVAKIFRILEDLNCQFFTKVWDVFF